VAISYVAAGAGNSGTGSFSVAVPSGIEAGDLLLILVQTANQPVAVPSGWDNVPSSPRQVGTAGGTAATALQVFYKFAGSSESSVTISDGGNHQIARMVAYRGVREATPFNASAGSVGLTASTTVSYPSITTTVADCRVLLIEAHSLPDANSNTVVTNQSMASLLSGTIERVDNNTNAGNGGGFSLADGLKATAGSTGTGSATLSTSANTARITLALWPGPDIVEADLGSDGATALSLVSGATAFVDLGVAAFAEAFFEDASSYPEAPTDGDILGAELLEYEIIAEAAGASFFDADMASTGSAALALATARVRPSTQSILGAATVSIPAAAVAASTAASAGSASVSISAARVLLSVASSSGSAAATLLSARVRTTNVTAAGAGALSAIASAIAGSSAAIAGTTTVSIPASGIRTSTATSSGAGVMSAAAARVIPGAVAASGSAAVTARAASVLPAVASASGSSAVSLPSGKIAAVNAQASGASAMNALGGSTAGAAVNSSGAAFLSLLADLIAEARALAAGSSALDLQSVLLRLGRVDSAAGSNAAFGGLGLAQTIAEQDMSRSAELRNMARGAADSLMIAVPGGIGEMERAAESRQMDRGRDEGASSVAGEGSMVRGKESRAMEITS
jgi:hypothetical protein